MVRYRNFKKKYRIPAGILPKYRSMNFEELCAEENSLMEESQRISEGKNSNKMEIDLLREKLNKNSKTLKELENQFSTKVEKFLEKTTPFPEQDFLSEVGIRMFHQSKLNLRKKIIQSNINEITYILLNPVPKSGFRFTYKNGRKFLLKKDYLEIRLRYTKILDLEGDLQTINEIYKKNSEIERNLYPLEQRRNIIHRLIYEEIPKLKKTSKTRDKIARLSAIDKKTRETSNTIVSQIRNENPDSFSCPYCLKQTQKNNAEVDHIIPVSNGGLNVRNNLVLVCKECNQKKRDKSIVEFCVVNNIKIESLYERLKKIGKKI